MTRILSTYLFVKRKLTPALVADIAGSGVNAVELFCGRSHFDYRSSDVVKELASALTDHTLAVHAVHAPAERDFGSSRDSSVPLSICDSDRSRRQEAVDEVKRALDMAEDMSFSYMVQHLGSSRDPNDPRLLEAAFNSLEHLRIFAKQRGVTIALENTPGELATPANLRQFLAETRLTDLRLCFDIGHAHLGDGVAKSFEIMRELVVTAHIHDNHGLKDEHLAPYEAAQSGERPDGKPTGASGLIDWKAALAELKAVPLVFELKEQPGWAEPTPASVSLGVARKAFDRVEEELAAAHEVA
jgi:sugar phosphate isomerase/epimerase